VPRIVGIDIPKEKRIETSLRYIYGIGLVTSKKILKTAGIKDNIRAKELTEEEVSRIAGVIQKNFKVEGDLKRERTGNVKRLMDIGCYRGQRHKKGLPVHGQRTHTNARTRKGPRKTMAGRAKPPSKG